MAETFTPVILTNDSGQKLNATYFNRLENNMETFDDRIDALEVGVSTHPVHAVGNSGTALTLDASSPSGWTKTITLNANCTFTFIGAASGRATTLELVLTQDSTGNRTVTWPDTVRWPNNQAPVLSTPGGTADVVSLTTYNSGATWLGVLVGKGYGAVTFSSPITITSGGTYSGNWESLDPAVPAIRINTTAPVIIQNSYIRSRGDCIRTIASNANVTVQNCRAYGLNPGVAGTSPGRFFVSEQFNRVIIDNNDIESTAGIYLLDKAGTGTETDAVKIRRNRVKNIDGRQSTGAGFSTSLSNIAQFVQLDKVVAGGCEISWNEVINIPGQCATEDLINIYESRGTSTNKIIIHNNFLDGSYPPSAATQGFSGGGIIADGANNTSMAWLEVYDNQVVATVNYALAIAAGNNCYMHDNRAVFSGELDDGTDVSATNIGTYVWNVSGLTGFTNNRIDQNVIGWYQRPANTRNDGWYPDCAVGGCDANSSLHAGAITLADEAAETSIWGTKRTTNGVTIGSTLLAL